VVWLQEGKKARAAPQFSGKSRGCRNTASAQQLYPLRSTFCSKVEHVASSTAQPPHRRRPRSSLPPPPPLLFPPSTSSSPFLFFLNVCCFLLSLLSLVVDTLFNKVLRCCW
jgi:hypothetical protein